MKFTLMSLQFYAFHFVNIKDLAHINSRHTLTTFALNSHYNSHQSLSRFINSDNDMNFTYIYVEWLEHFTTFSSSCFLIHSNSRSLSNSKWKCGWSIWHPQHNGSHLYSLCTRLRENQKSKWTFCCILFLLLSFEVSCVMSSTCCWLTQLFLLLFFF